MNFPKFQYRLQLFLLGLSRDLRTLFGLLKSKNNNPPDKILISGLVLLGDLVLISPLFQALKQEFPHASLELLVPEGWGVFSQTFKNIDRVFESKKNNPSWFRQFKSQHKNRWQLGVIPWSYASINLFYALNITQIRSFPDPKNRKLYRIHQKISLPTQADHFSLMTLALSSQAQTYYPAPYFNLEKISKIPTLFNLSSPYAIIHPGASNFTKYWGAENYAAMANYLISLGYHIILTGTAPEKILTEQIALKIPRALNLAGQTKLHELLVLISKAQLVLGPDTGVLHLTRALNIPSITLMGPTQFKIYGPHSKFHNLEITKALSVNSLPCQDAQTIFKHKISGVANCRRSVCLYPETYCMTGLTQDAVKNLINQVLKI